MNRAGSIVAPGARRPANDMPPRSSEPAAFLRRGPSAAGKVDPRSRPAFRRDLTATHSRTSRPRRSTEPVEALAETGPAAFAEASADRHRAVEALAETGPASCAHQAWRLFPQTGTRGLEDESCDDL